MTNTHIYMFLSSELLGYNKLSNTDVIELIAKNNVTNNYCLKLMSHILNAQEIWLARTQQKKSKFEVWQIHETNDIDHLNNLLNEKCVLYYDSLDKDDWARTIPYINSKNEKFENKICEIFYHIINHSTYHRAQIIAKLKSYDITPVPSDFIYYKNELIA